MWVKVCVIFDPLFYPSLYYILQKYFSTTYSPKCEISNWGGDIEN